MHPVLMLVAAAGALFVRLFFVRGWSPWFERHRERKRQRNENDGTAKH
jgi:hypothetical protein